jgi:hypothetical protein
MASGSNRLLLWARSLGARMSRRRRGDDADQKIMPFVERIEPPGNIRNSPDATPAKPNAALSPVPEPPRPEQPAAAAPSDQPALEVEWFVQYGGLRVQRKTSDRRSWSIRLLDGITSRFAGHLLFWLLLSLLTLIPSSTSRENGTTEGWAPIIERSK